MKHVTWLFILSLSLAEGFKLFSHWSSPQDEKKPAAEHGDYPRTFGHSSGNPQYENNKPPGPKLFGHIGDVLHGGSMGFGMEFRPLAPVIGMIEKAKKFIPGYKPRGTSKDDAHRDNPDRGKYERPNRPHRPERPQYERPERPHHERPVPDDNDWADESHQERPSKPQRPHHERPSRPQPPKPSKDEWPSDEDVRPSRPGQQRPNRPNKERPKFEESKEDDLPNWEDIGEHEHREIPIEDIIQPRQRPKRFIESKVYHVPLEFRSNAKPYKVKF